MLWLVAMEWVSESAAVRWHHVRGERRAGPAAAPQAEWGSWVVGRQHSSQMGPCLCAAERGQRRSHSRGVGPVAVWAGEQADQSVAGAVRPSSGGGGTVAVRGRPPNPLLGVGSRRGGLVLSRKEERPVQNECT